MALKFLNIFERAFLSIGRKALLDPPKLAVASCISATHSRNVRTNFPKQVSLPKIAFEQDVLSENEERDSELRKGIMSKVNEQIKENSHGRLFAVIQLCGKQFKVTNEDVIVIEGYWDPQAGDRIKMEKVLLVGASDFTLVGRPILPRSLVHVEGTVIEKELSQVKTRFRKRRRKQFRRIKFYRSALTMIRINTVELREPVNTSREVEGVDGRIF